MNDYPIPNIESLQLDHKIISIEYLPHVKNFSCGNHSMDFFLQVEAYPSHIIRESSTTLVFYQNQIVGYYTLQHTLLSSLIDDPAISKEQHVLDIARLAVSDHFQNKGIGVEIVNHILHMAIQLNERYIVLDALKEKWTWYRDKFNFESLFEVDLIHDSPFVTMFMDLYDEDLIKKYYDE
ncbi:GNAT family N-acetyltransferase [Paenibacillus sp. KACC 21273]|uniref:GNAT family N-acetyltransferase n=1 Tax=Paenibacillus sp. KACC 21273 TaxID=3025665 RepID=UPI0023662B6B|nr:GNAT family N-acetyltransferase [Paenibacillus sp. KACC 21273]WDF50136.1 GNAT family N-acetyltransferase [Paenibacillus sp. KACC 21273]